MELTMNSIAAIRSVDCAFHKKICSFLYQAKSKPSKQAKDKGFEPLRPFGQTVFKTAGVFLRNRMNPPGRGAYGMALGLRMGDATPETTRNKYELLDNAFLLFTFTLKEIRHIDNE